MADQLYFPMPHPPVALLLKVREASMMYGIFFDKKGDFPFYLAHFIIWIHKQKKKQ